MSFITIRYNRRQPVCQRRQPVCLRPTQQRLSQTQPEAQQQQQQQVDAQTNAIPLNMTRLLRLYRQQERQNVQQCSPL